jgi:Flp pilus assembly protein TadG
MNRRGGFGWQARQQGVALILVVVGMVAMLLMAGLALDGGHMFLNKTRLQNTVDAVALSAAKTLDETKGNTTEATTAAMAAFNSNAAAYGNAELQGSYGGGSGSLTVTVQYSATLRPFTPGAASGPYVRVIAAGFTMPAWLVNLAGITGKTVAATAVAGPSPALNRQVCNLAPMMVCGDPSKDPKDPSGDPDNFWGYEQGAPDVLKTAASGHWEGTPGPGNFQLIRLGGSGAAIVRENLAGGYQGCASVGDTIETEPGNTVGPVAQGLNTRFGQYAGPMNGTQDQYPPDVITDAQDPLLQAGEDPVTGEDIVLQNDDPITTANVADRLFDYEEYKDALDVPSTYDNAPPDGEFERRTVTIPVGDCSTTTNGHGYVPVLGFACFFLLQPAEQKGNEAHVFGQFVGECTVNGMPGTTPGTGPEPYRIQLYDDPDSGDS